MSDMPHALKKYGLRVLVSAFIYLFFRITSGTPEEAIDSGTSTWPVLLPYAVFVVLTVWEVCDRVIVYFAQQYPLDLGSRQKTDHDIYSCHRRYISVGYGVYLF